MQEVYTYTVSIKWIFTLLNCHIYFILFYLSCKTLSNVFFCSWPISYNKQGPSVTSSGHPTSNWERSHNKDSGSKKFLEPKWKKTERQQQASWGRRTEPEHRPDQSGTTPRKTPCVTELPTALIMAAILAPAYTPAPYPALPKCTLLLSQLMSSCCAITHTGLLFDFTPLLGWLRQARPGISAMWLKNGNRRQEYKRRHTGRGCGSVAGEWVVD